MKTYRCYETVKNAGGGLDSIGGDWEQVEADTAQEAAEQHAASLREIQECRGNVVVATDDDGDSAQATV